MKAFNILIGAAVAVGAALSVRAAAGCEVVCAASDTPEALRGVREVRVPGGRCARDAAGGISAERGWI